jgi:hypothetical protein
MAMDTATPQYAPLYLTATRPCTTSGAIQYGEPTSDTVRVLSGCCKMDMPKSASFA